MIRVYLLGLAALLCVAGATAQAFTEDFEDDTANADPTDTGYTYVDSSNPDAEVRSGGAGNSTKHYSWPNNANAAHFRAATGWDACVSTSWSLDFRFDQYPTGTVLLTPFALHGDSTHLGTIDLATGEQMSIYIDSNGDLESTVKGDGGSNTVTHALDVASGVWYSLDVTVDCTIGANYGFSATISNGPFPEGVGYTFSNRCGTCTGTIALDVFAVGTYSRPGTGSTIGVDVDNINTVTTVSDAVVGGGTFATEDFEDDTVGDDPTGDYVYSEDLASALEGEVETGGNPGNRFGLDDSSTDIARFNTNATITDYAMTMDVKFGGGAVGSEKQALWSIFPDLPDNPVPLDSSPSGSAVSTPGIPMMAITIDDTGNIESVTRGYGAGTLTLSQSGTILEGVWYTLTVTDMVFTDAEMSFSATITGGASTISFTHSCTTCGIGVTLPNLKVFAIGLYERFGTGTGYDQSIDNIVMGDPGDATYASPNTVTGISAFVDGTGVVIRERDNVNSQDVVKSLSPTSLDVLGTSLAVNCNRAHGVDSWRNNLAYTDCAPGGQVDEIKLRSKTLGAPVRPDNCFPNACVQDWDGGAMRDAIRISVLPTLNWDYNLIDDTNFHKAYLATGFGSSTGAVGVHLRVFRDGGPDADKVDQIAGFQTDDLGADICTWQDLNAGTQLFAAANATTVKGWRVSATAQVGAFAGSDSVDVKLTERYAAGSGITAPKGLSCGNSNLWIVDGDGELYVVDVFNNLPKLLVNNVGTIEKSGIASSRDGQRVYLWNDTNTLLSYDATGSVLFTESFEFTGSFVDIVTDIDGCRTWVAMTTGVYYIDTGTRAGILSCGVDGTENEIVDPDPSVNTDPQGGGTEGNNVGGGRLGDPNLPGIEPSDLDGVAGMSATGWLWFLGLILVLILSGGMLGLALGPFNMQGAMVGFFFATGVLGGTVLAVGLNLWPVWVLLISLALVGLAAFVVTRR